MKKQIGLLLLMILSQVLIGQPNCAAIKDSLCLKACEMTIEAAKWQGSKHSQELFDQSIVICPTAYAYFEKAVPYLKRGLYKEWKQLTDKAVALDSKYLLQRGINQVQFLRNYEAGLADLTELHELKNSFDIGFSPSGEYHGQLIRAICFQKTGALQKAIDLMETLVSADNYSQSPYDYFHLGVAYLETGNLEKAKLAFEEQNDELEIAGTAFYYAQIYQKEGNVEMEKKMLEQAKTLYAAGSVMHSIYYHYIDQVFQSDIEQALLNLETDK